MLGSAAVKGNSNNDVHLIGLAYQLSPNRCGTKGAKIFIFVPLREDQKKALAHRNSSFALRTIEFGSIKLLKCFFPGGIC